MALETATYISDLVATNPPASDPISQASNHLNLLKATLKATFPNVKGAMSASHENLNNGTPVGIIAMWSGAVLPAGWTLCNGVAVAKMDGTGNITPPDLRDRFLVGSGASYALGAFGGIAGYQLQTSQLPPHSHVMIDNGHVHGVNDPSHTHGVNDPQHSHGVPVSGGGGGLGFSEPGSFNGNYVNDRPAATGISIAANNTGISIALNGTGIQAGLTGSGVPIENRPPFYALAFIMKV